MMSQLENRQLIENARCYVQEHFNDPHISLEEVAMNAGFSTNYFNQIFTAHTGFSVMEYVRFERLRKAAAQLQMTNHDILDIALENGYSSHEGFLRAFKQQYGCTPSEYQEKKKGNWLCWREAAADPTLKHRFLHDYPHFKPIDEDWLVDSLLSKDARKYGYLCVTIKSMAEYAFTDLEDPDQGIVLAGNAFSKEQNYTLTLVCDDAATISRWLGTLNPVTAIHTSAKEAVPKQAVVRKEYMFLQAPVAVKLPEGLSIRPLSSADQKQILLWAKDRKDNFVQHLLHFAHCENDENILEYGVFLNGQLLAVASCAPEQIHGFRLNDCINIQFAKGVEYQELYRPVYSWITNDLAARDMIPFDNIQYGAFAERNGGFTSEQLGYTFVHERYELEV